MIEFADALYRKLVVIWDKEKDFSKLQEAILADEGYAKLVFIINSLLGSRWRYRFHNFYHPLICLLISSVNKGGIPALMDRETQLKNTGFDFFASHDPVIGLVALDYPTEDLDFSPTGGYSSYNWELFFHIPFEIGVLLNQQQRFEEAQTWFHYIFNPLGATGDASKPNAYWNTKPFFNRTIDQYRDQLIDQILYVIANDPQATHIEALRDSVGEWRRNPFSPYVVARTRTVSLQVALIFRYIKNLLDWGDSLFRQFTRESITAATQLYILADKLLGPKPRQVPPAVPTPTHTFNQLESKLDIFGNALLTLENLVPDLGTLPHQGQELSPPTSGITFSSLYFAIPQNKTMLEYWDRVADRLYKIRNSQNIDGVFTPLSFFASPIDPGAIVRALGSGASLTSILQGFSAPVPVYRFWFVTQKATELVLLASSLGSALLSALEKRDAEELARLGLNQEIAVLAGIRSIKLAAIAEAEHSRKSFDNSLLVAEQRKIYYSIQPFMNKWEEDSVKLAGEVAGLHNWIMGMELTAAGLHSAPNFEAGISGFGGSPVAAVELGGEILGGAAELAAKVLEHKAASLERSSAMLEKQGEYHHRAKEWSHNVDLADGDIRVITEQIKAAKEREKAMGEELKAHDLRAKAESETLKFMKSKYTNKELYDWMIRRISSTYFAAYSLAYDVAKRAEQSFIYELADTTSGPFIKYEYWDSLKSGLLAAETLIHDIKKMEAAYMDRNKREFELSKNVSLAELDPYALISLKATGQCFIQLPEEFYDLDYPGHYLRRIKSVSVSIPCVVGPQVSVSATLSLTSNRYRKNTTDGDAYTESPVNGDPRFAYNVGSIQSIALSTAVNDAGVFELNFNGERYLPFEGMGAIGSWKLELPKVIRRFDYDTITDVVFHIRYTARDGGSKFKAAVEKTQLESLNKMVADAKYHGLHQGYNLRQQFSSEWAQLLRTNSTKLTFEPRHLPYCAHSHSPKILSVMWFVNAKTNSA